MKQPYLYPPAVKRINGRTFFLHLTTGRNHQDAIIIARNIRRFHKGLSVRVVGISAPSYVYSEGAVYYVYYR